VLPRRTLFIGDTYVNYDPTAEQLAEMTLLAADEVARFGLTPKIHNNFHEVLEFALTMERIAKVGRQDTEQEVEVVCDFPAWQFAAPRSRPILLT